MNRYDAIEAIARNIGDYYTGGTSSSATATTIDAAFLVEQVTGQIGGYWLYARTGTIGQSRVTTDSVPASNRVVVAQTLNPIPTQSYFTIFRQIPKDQYDHALDTAIRRAKRHYLEDSVATMQMVATQYEYPVPSGMAFVNSIQIVPSGGSDYGSDDEVDRIFHLDGLWHIRPNPEGSRVIVFDPRDIDMDVVDEELVKVFGQAELSVGDYDHSTIPDKLEDYVTNYAAMVISASKISNVEGDPWRAKFQLYKNLADETEPYIHVRARGQEVG